MAEYRITESNPVRDTPGLDFERCAALHNLVVERGWHDSGRKLEDLDQSTWWDLYSDQVETLRLKSDLVSFLKSSQEGYVSCLPEHNFHRYVAGLSPPDQIFSNALYGADEDESDKCRYITLYMPNWALGASHPLGLIYDQDNRRAMMHMSQDDSMITMNGRQEWVRLEEFLEALLQMMDEGKIRAVGGEYEEDGQQECISPWIMPSFTGLDVQDTLAAWRELVAEIEDGIRSLPNTREPATVVLRNPTADYEHLPESSFARVFLESAGRPSFTFVAPGLQLARRQPFLLVQPQSEDELRPVLLFENDQSAHMDTETAPWGQVMKIPVFHPYFQGAVESVPAGLYLTESDPLGTQPFEDGVKLILPFPIGSAGFARTSDNALLGEDRISAGTVPRSHAPRSSELYQSGYNAFIGRHDVQLRRVIRHWKEMVRSGKWEVDENGVRGGIEKWREADTEQLWKDYVLPRTW